MVSQPTIDSSEGSNGASFFTGSTVKLTTFLLFKDHFPNRVDHPSLTQMQNRQTARLVNEFVAMLEKSK